MELQRSTVGKTLSKQCRTLQILLLVMAVSIGIDGTTSGQLMTIGNEKAKPGEELRGKSVEMKWKFIQG